MGEAEPFPLCLDHLRLAHGRELRLRAAGYRFDELERWFHSERHDEERLACLLPQLGKPRLDGALDVDGDRKLLA